MQRRTVKSCTTVVVFLLTLSVTAGAEPTDPRLRYETISVGGMFSYNGEVVLDSAGVGETCTHAFSSADVPPLDSWGGSSVSMNLGAGADIHLTYHPPLTECYYAGDVSGQTACETIDDADWLTATFDAGQTPASPEVSAGGGNCFGGFRLEAGDSRVNFAGRCTGNHSVSYMREGCSGVDHDWSGSDGGIISPVSPELTFLVVNPGVLFVEKALLQHSASGMDGECVMTAHDPVEACDNFFYGSQSWASWGIETLVGSQWRPVASASLGPLVENEEPSYEETSAGEETCVPVEAGRWYRLAVGFGSQSEASCGPAINGADTTSFATMNHFASYEFELLYVALAFRPREILVPGDPVEGTTTAVLTEQPSCGSDIVWDFEGDSHGLQIEPSGTSARIIAGPDAQPGTVIVRARLCGDPNCVVTAPLEIGCGCGPEGCTGGAMSANLSSFDVGFSLGKDVHGKPVGKLRLFGKEITPHSVDMEAVCLNVLRDDLSEYRGQVSIPTSSGSMDLRAYQVKTPSCLAVVTPDILAGGEGCNVRFYHFAQLDNPADSEGPWNITAGEQPYDAYAVYPTPYGSASPSAIHIGRYRYDEVLQTLAIVEKDVYRFSQGTGQWSWALDRGQSGLFDRREKHSWEDLLPEGDGLARYKKIITMSECPHGATCTVETELEVVSYAEEIHKDFPWGRAVVERSVYPTGDDTGTPLTTTYQYYYSTDPGHEHDLGRLKVQENPDGSWVAFRYDAQGRVTLRITPWGNDAANKLPADPATWPTTTALSCRKTAYTYTGTDIRPTSVTSYVVASEGAGAVTVSRTEYTYVEDLVGGDGYTVEKRCLDPVAGAAGGSLDTVTGYLLDEDGKTKHIEYVEYPDGRVDIYEYEEGSFNFSDTNPGFAQAIGGPDRRTLVTHYVGTHASPVAIAGQTTTDTVVTNSSGYTVLTETYYGATLSDRMSWTAYQLDDLGHVTETYRSNGTRSDTSWDCDCCRPCARTDAKGVATTYEYDALKRLTKQTKLGHAGTADIETTYTRSIDVNGRREEVVVTSAALGQDSASTTNTRRYQLNGRIDEEVDAASLVTTYEYDDDWFALPDDDDGRKVIVHRPDGSTEITEYQRDGRVKSATGSGAVARYYEYQIDVSNPTNPLMCATVFVADYSPIPKGPRWTKTCHDALGRIAKEERPGYGTPNIVTTYTYYAPGDASAGASPGRLAKVETSGRAPTVYKYDAFGNVTMTGLDVDDNGLDPMSNDRITESETAYVSEGGAWWRKSSTTTYTESGSSDARIVSVQRERLTGFTLPFNGASAMDTSYAESWTVYHPASGPAVEGPKTTSTTTITRNDTQVNRAVNVPGADPQTSLTVNGLLDSSTSSDGITHTYGYDVLGRQTTVTGGRSNTTLATYNAAGQVESVTDTAGQTTNYTYYGDGGAGAGQVATSYYNVGAQTLYTRYAYDDHGRLVKIWGDVPQPTWVEYDDYGQRSKLHTYRGDGALGTWPDTPGAGDITEWRYHDATGLLEHKLYADGTSVDYTYTDYNQLDIRTWARGVTSDYDYNPATGELTTITYSDGTPGVGFTYDRLGRTATVTDATGTHTMGYNIYGALASDAIAGSFYTDTITVAPQHEDETGTIPGRFNGLQVTHGTTGVYSANYEYDDYGRISRVTGPGLPAYGAAYTYFDLSDGTSVIRVLPTVLDVKFMTDPTTTLARGSRRYEGTRDLVNRTRITGIRTGPPRSSRSTTIGTPLSGRTPTRPVPMRSAAEPMLPTPASRSARLSARTSVTTTATS